jgi:hypothetical protein
VVYRVWGWDELTYGCWISLTDPPARLRWAAGTLFAWTLLSAAVALVSTYVVLAHLVRKRTATRRAFRCSMLVEDHVVARVAVRVVWYPILLRAHLECARCAPPLTRAQSCTARSSLRPSSASMTA